MPITFSKQITINVMPDWCKSEIISHFHIQTVFSVVNLETSIFKNSLVTNRATQYGSLAHTVITAIRMLYAVLLNLPTHPFCPCD